MIQNKVFDSWLNARGFDPNHPLLQRLKKFSALGADLDVIFALCCMLALSNAVRSCAIETKKRLADRSRRWRKELGGLLSSHPGGKLRLNEVAHRYTISIIRSTLDHLTAKGLIDSTVVIEGDGFAQIKQQALAPFAKMKGFPEDLNAAINESDYSGTSNLLEAVGLTKITPEQGEYVKKLLSLFWPSIFANEGTKRRDDAGSIFLLFVTEHLREKTRTKTRRGDPHFELAFNLMRSLQDKLSRKIEEPRRSATSRVNKLKNQWPQWQAETRRLEQMVQASRACLSTEKVN